VKIAVWRLFLRAHDDKLCAMLRRSTIIDRLLRATKNSWDGLRHAARNETAFRQELAAFILAAPLAFIIATETWKRFLLIGVVLLLLVVELLNTAIEKLADRVSREIEPQIGHVKDLGSAAVGLMLILAGFAWLIALAERLGLI
jgi:diacylglycerol kinase (ATP)